MKHRTLIVAIALFSMADRSHAETLHKCVGKDRAVSYTGAPCKAGENEARSIDYKPETSSHRLPAPAATREQQMDRQTRLRGHRSERYVESTTETERHRCDAAKAQRDAAYRRLGIHRTYTQSRAWDETVRQACI